MTKVERPARIFEQGPTDVDEQLNLLASRGLAINDRGQARNRLRHLSFCRLKSYLRYYEEDSNSHRFRAGTRFVDVIELYEFDRKLRLLVLDATERIEVSLRRQWSSQFAKAHGPHCYRDPKVCKGSKWEKQLASLEKDLRKSKEDLVVHYRKKFNTPSTPPIWTAAEVMTFGQISRWISELTPLSVLAEMVKAYKLPVPVFKSLIHHLTYVRNLSAHHSRLWNRRLLFAVKLPRKEPSSVVQSINSERTLSFYNTAVMIEWTLKQIDPSSTWGRDFIALAQKRPDLLDRMGFPPAYQALPVWT